MSERAQQVRQGAFNRWRARFGLSWEEYQQARELRIKIRMSMAEACRVVVRSARII